MVRIISSSGPHTNIGALRIRIGFWGQLFYNYKKESPRLRPPYYGLCVCLFSSSAVRLQAPKP